MKTASVSRFSRLGFISLAALVCAAPAAAQDEPAFGFGAAEPVSAAEASSDSPDSGAAFGFADQSAGLDSRAGFGSSAGGALSITGKAQAAFDAYTDDLDSEDSLRSFDPGNLFSGKVRLDVSGSRGEAHIGFAFGASGAAPAAVDEGWVRAFWGKADVEAGFRKIVWGKADSEGPLDLINPVDLSDLRVTDQLERKIARPMLRAGFALGAFTRLEAAFVPSFVPDRLAYTGRWSPAALGESVRTFSALIQSGGQTAVAQTISAMIAAGILNPADPGQIGAVQLNLGTSLQASLAPYQAAFSSGSEVFGSFSPDTANLNYAQYGLRLTTSIASQDLGFQYVYGNRKTPSVSIDTQKLFIAQVNPLAPETSTLIFNPDAISVSYDRFHQAGIDWASVVATLNLRAEAAVNMTEDLAGSDGAVSNPDFSWSFGFDRDIAGFAILAQGFGSVVLMHDKIGKAPDDCQGDADAASTRILARISRSFLRGALDISATVVSGIEDRDWMCLGEISSTRDAVSVGLKGGLFGGSRDGGLGQYRDNGWAAAYMSYAF